MVKTGCPKCTLECSQGVVEPDEGEKWWRAILEERRSEGAIDLP